MSLQTAIGSTIRGLRHERQMTLRDLCDKSYVSIGHLSQVERGQKNPPPPTLEALADGLEITIAELVYEIYQQLKETN